MNLGKSRKPSVGSLPLGSILGFIVSLREGAGNDATSLGKGANISCGDSLDEDIASSSRFHGACDDATARGAGRALIEKIIANSSTDNMESVDRLLGDLLQLSEGLSIKQGKALDDAEGDCTN